ETHLCHSPLAVLLAAGAALPSRAAQAAPPSPILYLALGDSLAVGVGATDPRRLGYVPHLFDFFHGASHGSAGLLTNLAVGGASSRFITDGQLAAAVAAIGDPPTA